MNRWIVVIAVSALLLGGCNRKKAEQESAGETTTGTPNLVQMSESAQQHVGLVVAPATVTQLNEYLHVTGTVQPIDSHVGVVTFA